ncbi:TetR/AcrR family transcriptional regulator [Cytobacillus sp. FJAT-53684]|uniref:TetR/AcrR family transcriptional regulator n=1 Tax=Cytobacillus mangrovibacter TaxID=3299024 RepID=A0ABW6K2Q7_9BACI
MPKIVDHDKRKELIADAMMTVIKRVGLEKTTVRRIAEEVGLSMGSVQYYFPAQHDLYIYAMELLIQRLEDRVKNAVQEDIAVTEAVATILKQLIPFQDEEHKLECEVWLAFSVMALRDPALETLSRNMYTSVRELIRQLLTALLEERLLEASFDLEIGAMSLHAFIDGITTQAILYQGLFDEGKIDVLIKDYLQNICKK